MSVSSIINSSFEINLNLRGKETTEKSVGMEYILSDPIKQVKTDRKKHGRKQNIYEY